MKRPLVLAAVLALGVLTPVTVALADPNLPDVSAHRHYVVTPSGASVEVGPRLCDDPSLQGAFNQYHHNVHRSNGSTKGPQLGAPGLHNHVGADISVGGCNPS
jgi:hypothetical protein